MSGLSYICAGIYLSDWRTACLIDYEDAAMNYGICLVITAMDADEVDYYGIEGDVDFKGVAWSWLTLQDDDEVPIGNHFKSVCEDIDAARAAGKAVLVHCMAGVSRSPTLVAAYLMWRKAKTLQSSVLDGSRITAAEALAYLKERRACVDPNPGFRQQLLQWETELGI